MLLYGRCLLAREGKLTRESRHGSIVLVGGGVRSRRFEVPQLETVGAAGRQLVHEPKPVPVPSHGVLTLFQIHAEPHLMNFVCCHQHHLILGSVPIGNDT